MDGETGWDRSTCALCTSTTLCWPCHVSIDGERLRTRVCGGCMLRAAASRFGIEVRATFTKVMTAVREAARFKRVEVPKPPIVHRAKAQKGLRDGN